MDKFERVYIEVPIDEKEAAKRIGAILDRGAKKWWVRPDVVTPWPVVEVAWKERRDACEGYCMDGGRGSCGACELTPCPGCGYGLPQYMLDVHGGHCVNCAVQRSSGRRTVNEELEQRRRGGKRYCMACWKPLVPIGSGRERGADHDDWVDRLYHKTCLRNKRRRGEVGWGV
jgi:hypothetical protein